MNQAGNLNPKRIFSWPQLVGVMVACALTLYLLVPDDPSLLEDLVRDQRVSEARRVLRKVKPQQREQEPLRYAIAEQKLDQIEVHDAGDRADYDTYLEQSWQRWEQQSFAAALLTIWIDDLPRVARVENLWDEFSPRWDQIPAQLREELVMKLVPVALAQEKAALAADIFARNWGDAPSSEPAALELVRLRRLAGDSNGALTALGNLDSSRGRETRIALLRELNRNETALDLILAAIGDGRTTERSAVTRLVEVARGAGQSSRAVPVVLAYLDTHPKDLEIWRSLVILQREGGLAAEAAGSQKQVVELSGRSDADLKEWGRLLEGSSQPHKAFEVWRELGLRNDLFAIDRLIALNPGLYRNRELAEVLEQVVPVAGHDDYTLQLARLLTELGRYDVATDAYDQYLRAEPADLTAMLEIASLEIELFRYAEAAQWLERIKSLGVSDVGIRRKLGDTLIRMGEFDSALEEYRTVAETTRDIDDYGNYLRVARGVGAYEDFVAGLEGVIASAEATVSDYLTLAYGYELIGQDAKAKATLKEGIRRFPSNPEMPMRLAYAYADARNYRDAQKATTLHPQLGRALEPTRLHLNLMRLNNDIAAEREFLKRDFPAEIWADSESKQLIARGYLALGDLKTSSRLLRELHEEIPGDWDVTADLVLVLQRLGKTREAKQLLAPLVASNEPTALRLAAEVSSALGENADAERFQLRYLALVAPGAPSDWGALGDIRLARGDRNGAKQAYRKALREMQLIILAADGGPR